MYIAGVNIIMPDGSVIEKGSVVADPSPRLIELESVIFVPDNPDDPREVISEYTPTEDVQEDTPVEEPIDEPVEEPVQPEEEIQDPEDTSDDIPEEIMDEEDEESEELTTIDEEE